MGNNACRSCAITQIHGGALTLGSDAGQFATAARSARINRHRPAHADDHRGGPQPPAGAAEPDDASAPDPANLDAERPQARAHERDRIDDGDHSVQWSVSQVPWRSPRPPSRCWSGDARIAFVNELAKTPLPVWESELTTKEHLHPCVVRAPSGSVLHGSRDQRARTTLRPRESLLRASGADRCVRYTYDPRS